MLDLIANIIGTRGLLILVAILLIISIGLGTTVKIQSARLDAAKAKIETQTVQLQGLGKQVTAQNAAVEQMLANAALTAERLHAAESAAGQVRVITQDRIQYVQQAAIPATCPEAVTWGATHAVEIGKRWKETTP